LTIKDLNSANGTFVKVDRPLPIEDGDQIWLGQRRFRFVLPGTRRPSAVVEAEATHSRQRAALTPSSPVAAKASAASAAVTAQPASAAVQSTPAAAGGLVVTFANVGKTVPLRRGQTICEAAEEHGIHVVADCHQGICGSDPVRIVSGTENLNAMSDAERGTLEDICSLEPGVHRLACMARLQGAATVEIIQS
jgi:ferredoxin